MKTIDEVNERGFGEILDFINSGVYITDTERRIVFWNHAAEQITGYPAAEVVGRSCSDNIMSHRDKDGNRLCTTDRCPLYRAIVRNSRAAEPFIVYAYSRAGRNLPLSTSVAPVLDDDGNVIGGIEVFRDETEPIREMELARTVQRQMLTAEPPSHERLSFQVQYVPKEMIGGDFYALRALPDERFLMFLGDAAGHGASAALYGALVYALLEECKDYLSDPAALCAAMNERACARASGLGFLTAVAVVVDARTGEAVYCEAGHPPLILQRAGAGAELLEHAHLPIGVSEGASYENSSVRLGAGDRLLAYSDGATDVLIGPEARLGTEGLVALVGEFPPADGVHRLGALYNALLERCATVQPDDDITLVSCLAL